MRTMSVNFVFRVLCYNVGYVVHPSGTNVFDTLHDLLLKICHVHFNKCTYNWKDGIESLTNEYYEEFTDVRFTEFCEHNFGRNS